MNDAERLAMIEAGEALQLMIQKFKETAAKCDAFEELCDIQREHLALCATHLKGLLDYGELRQEWVANTRLVLSIVARYMPKEVEE